MAGSESQVIGTEMERVSTRLPVLFDKEDDLFYRTVEKKQPLEISGRDAKIPLHLRPAGNTSMYNPDGGALGRGEFPDFDKAIINCVHLRHAVEFSAKTHWATDSSRKATIDAFRKSLAESMPQFRRDNDSLCMTDGTGVMATITSVSTTNGIDTYTCTTDGFGVRLLRPKQHFNVFSSTLTVCRTAGGPQFEGVVSFYDLANKQIQCTSIPGVVPGDLIVVGGMQSTPPNSIYGVKYHNSNASTGTWLGFDRSLTPEIRANRVAANNGALTLPLPRLALNKIGDRVGMSNRKKMTAWMHPAQDAAYEELGFNVSRVDKGAKEEGLDLFFNDNKRIAGAPMKKHYSWDRTRIDFVDGEVWGRVELKPCGFYMNPQDKTYLFPLRAPDGGLSAGWIFYLVVSYNIFMDNPAAASYIDQLAVPPGY